MDKIERRFRAAGLEAKVLEGPLARANRGIFQIDIQRANKGQRYGVFRGDGDNRIEVTNTDPKIRQLVLFVEEKERTFEQEVRYFGAADRLRRLAGVREARGRVVREKEGRLIVELKTSATKRHLLLGMDEAHLFIAQLPRGASSVKQAHDVLRPEEVRGRKDVLRQGEWFFVPANADELALIATAEPRRRDLGSAGRPHVADEVVEIREAKATRLYARGHVRHVEHRTLALHRWMRVHKNTEVRNDFRALGITWID
jgi:hypothetical protein